ncbi:oligosaccharide flippase family protein [Pseudoalteromonas shioyasakiensis]|uniref:oligosaccharide flippase family protein n=1 Tax=Pseudoalteromonas shioyasakiensis TaxID=1190813 RepID=UPI002551E5AE|nr:oligosaccharide flippase family protein [Pseudoalteromonas shioyasakiensis]MDK9684925.1 oligosaccharide flippase family protein [Pseudoalteromonas shioyasakiensis]
MKISILLMLERYAKVASGAIYVLFLARYLGPKDYGAYSAGLAVAGLLGVFALAGVDGLFQKKLSVSKEKSEIFFSFFLIKLVPVLIATSFYFLYVFYSGEGVDLLIVCFLPFTISLVLSFSYQGLLYEEKYKEIIKISFSIIAISNIFRIYLFLYTEKIELYALAYSMEALLLTVIYSVVFIRQINVVSTPSFRVLKSIFKDGFPLIVSTLIIGSVSKVVLLNIEQSSSLEVVGQFALSMRVVEAALLLAVASSMIGLKALLTNYGTDKYFYQKRIYIRNMYALSFLSMLLTFVFFFFISSYLFGTGYAYSYKSCILISLLVFFNFIAIYNGRLLVVEELYKFAFFRSLFSLVFFFILVVYFNESFNLEEALLTLLAFWFSSSFIFMSIFKKTRRMFF